MRRKIPFLALPLLFVLGNSLSLGEAIISDGPSGGGGRHGQVLGFRSTPVTKTSFRRDELVERESLPYQQIVRESEDLYLGELKVSQEGQEGWRERVYQVTYWQGQPVDRTLVSVITHDPVPEVLLQGTKVAWRKLVRTEGEFDYCLRKKMFATSYDGNCRGCNGVTYTGTVVRKGVCAVDPEVIPLGSKLYVEGYGLCRAEDIGGLIKGDRIDLGFADVSEGFWSARWTDVYLLAD